MTRINLFFNFFFGCRREALEDEVTHWRRICHRQKDVIDQLEQLLKSHHIDIPIAPPLKNDTHDCNFIATTDTFTQNNAQHCPIVHHSSSSQSWSQAQPPS